MKLIKETYIHNRIIFNEEEQNILVNAYNIISYLENDNALQNTSEDTYLSNICFQIKDGISELLLNYSNEYLRKEG